MSIEINTQDYRVNRYSDFELVMSLLKDGTAYVPTQFVAVFYADNWNDCCGRYTASLINGKCTNCAVSGNSIRVFIDSPRFNLGQLKCKFLDMVDAESFSDGTLDVCTPFDLPVEIVAGAGNTGIVVLGGCVAYFGENHDLVIESTSSTVSSSPSFGDNNDLSI